MGKRRLPVPAEEIEPRIVLIRGRRVMLDGDLAQVYQVETRALNQAVKRNRERFPDDFMLHLTSEEVEDLRSQSVISKRRRGGRRYRPYAFTEHGAVMLASVLNSPVAVQASIQVVRAFVQLRGILSAHKELSRRLDELERKYDAEFAVVFEAIRRLMEPADEKRGRIGFRPRKG